MNKMSIINSLIQVLNNPKETNQKPAGGFLIAHFKRYASEEKAGVDMMLSKAAVTQLQRNAFRPTVKCFTS